MRPIVVGVAASTILAGSVASAAPDATRAVRCAKGAVAASVGGKRVCLHADRACTRRFDLQYHRYKFHCHGGRLVSDDWAPLFRPLRVRRLPRGDSCPAATADPDGDLSRWGFGGTAWGRGPAYPGTPSAESDRLVITFEYPPPRQSINAGSKWSGQKVNWIVASTYDGLFLIRGRQLDGPLLLRFGRGIVPSAALRARGEGDHPSSVRLRERGCYAFQVDGFGFSSVIVFEARQRGTE